MVKRFRIFAVLAAMAAGIASVSAQSIVVLTEHSVSAERARCEVRGKVRWDSPRDFWKKERWSVRGGMATPPYTAATFAEGVYYSFWRMDSGKPLSEIYGEYNGVTRSTGAFCLGAEYLLARWFAVAADFSITPVWHELYSGVTRQKTGTKSGVAFCLIPQVKFIYMNRPAVRLYSKFGIGAVKCFGFERRDRESFNFELRKSDNSWDAAIQWAPFGIEAGRKFFGYAELGLGTLYNGISAGVGYKF